MKMSICLILTAFALVLCDFSVNVAPQPAEAEEDLATRAGAPLFDGMGSHHHEITTSDPDAQRYFNQGLIIDFAFNHAESARSFRAAQRLDPECAMAYWGEALALGPNINVTSNGKAIMADDDRRQAYAAIRKAVALKGKASLKVQDFIDALATRYNGDHGLDEKFESFTGER